MSAARATVQAIGATRATPAPPSVQPARSRNAAKPKRQHASKRIRMRQAENIVDAVAFAKSIGLPLVAHLTIHWAYTDIGDDPDGALFKKFREGFDKWLGRQDITFAAAWARERQSSGQSDVVHCHLLFHLPVDYQAGRKLRQLHKAIYRLIGRHGRRDGHTQGDGYWADEVAKLVIHPEPDGKYLIKGGGPSVWNRFGLRKEHRRRQGLIHGKRCGTTENIGQAARRRWNNDHERNKRCASGEVVLWLP